MSLLLYSGGVSSKCRTIDKVDIFGDSSGVALYQLDGNANDTGGNYHGTETNVAYGSGVYERGAVFNGASSILVPSLAGIKTLSVFSKRSTSGASMPFIGGTSSDEYIGWSASNINYFRISVGGVATDLVNTIPISLNVFYHIVFVWTSSTNIALYVNRVFQSNTTVSAYMNSPTYIGRRGTADIFLNGVLDQVRIFNRAITETEVATLYAECAPTSTVDNINPFMDGSLKALYQFNGDATDATGVYNGTATNVTYGTGKFGQCAVFNGTSSKVAFTAISTTKAISFWTNKAITTGASYKMFLGKASGGKYISTGDIQTYLSNETLALANGTGSAAAYITSVFNDTTWKHIVMQYHADNNISIYVNAIKQTVSYYGTITNILAEFDQFGVSGASDGWLDASIDQIRIFNKALTPMEVASLYNETTPLEEPMYKLVDPFKDGSGKALYRLEGNALDESGNYDGTATSVTYGAGQFGRCGVFNGTTSEITSTWTGTNDFSISVWVSATDTTPTTFKQITGGASVTNPYSYFIDLLADGHLEFNDSHGTATWLATPASTLSVDNAWYHIVVTKVGTARKIYVNNVLKASDSLGTVTPSKPTGIMIGKYWGSTAQSWSGSIDQVRAFNRVLTAGEVSTLYTAEATVLP